MNISRMRYKSIEHALAIGEVYFTLKPKQWLYEPVERFKIDKKEYVWSPDFIMGYGSKLYAGEVQLTALSEKRWANKWLTWNLYFKEAFKTAKFQQWSSSGKVMMPNFVVITPNKKAAHGFNIPGRELKVISTITELF